MRALIEFEEFLSEELPECRFEGPGILISQISRVALAINAVRCRAGLMIAATQTLRATEIGIIETHLEPWFEGAGYEVNPWTIAFEDWAGSHGIRTNVVSIMAHGATERSPLPVAQSLYFKSLAWARKKPFLRRLKRAFGELRAGSPPRLPGEWSNLRVLFSDTVGYDWVPVYRYLHQRGARLYLLESDLHDALATYSNGLDCNNTERMQALVQDKKNWGSEAAEIALAFNRWAGQTSWRSSLSFAGVDTFRALGPYVRALAARGPALLRKTDCIVASALDRATPQAVCFFTIVYPHHKRMAFECARRGIPVFCYQHGGTYGTHDAPNHDFLENAYADYFLVYGLGITPPGTPSIPGRATYVPTGSARLEALRHESVSTPVPRKTEAKLHVVWAGDYSKRNGINSGTEIEDTARYRLETECLSILSRSTALRVSFRPFPGDMAAQATPAWLRRMKLPNITINTHSRMVDLMRRADILITISSSGTVWNEALLLGRPMIAYSNPIYTKMSEEFVEELNNACFLCRNDQDLKAAMEQFADEGAAFFARFAHKTSASYLQKYVLHHGDCAAKASRFLAETCYRLADAPSKLTGHY